MKKIFLLSFVFFFIIGCSVKQPIQNNKYFKINNSLDKYDFKYKMYTQQNQILLCPNNKDNDDIYIYKKDGKWVFETSSGKCNSENLSNWKQNKLDQYNYQYSRNIFSLENSPYLYLQIEKDHSDGWPSSYSYKIIITKNICSTDYINILKNYKYYNSDKNIFHKLIKRYYNKCGYIPSPFRNEFVKNEYYSKLMHSDTLLDFLRTYKYESDYKEISDKKEVKQKFFNLLHKTNLNKLSNKILLKLKKQIKEKTKCVSYGFFGTSCNSPYWMRKSLFTLKDKIGMVLAKAINFKGVDFYTINIPIRSIGLYHSKDGFLVREWLTRDLVKLSRNGKILWKKENKKNANLFGLVFENRNKVYFSQFYFSQLKDSGKILILNSKTGKEIKTIDLKDDWISSYVRTFSTVEFKKFYVITDNSYLLEIKDDSLKWKSLSFLSGKINGAIVSLAKDGLWIRYGNTVYIYNFNQYKTFSFSKYVAVLNTAYLNNSINNKPFFVLSNDDQYKIYVGNKKIGYINLPKRTNNVGVVYLLSPSEALVLSNKFLVYINYSNNDINYYKIISLPYSVYAFSSFFDLKENIIYVLCENEKEILAIKLKK